MPADGLFCPACIAGALLALTNITGLLIDNFAGSVIKGGFAQRGADIDVRHRLQPLLGEGGRSQRDADIDVWHKLQPKLGQHQLAQRSAEHIRLRGQSDRTGACGRKRKQGQSGTPAEREQDDTDRKDKANELIASGRSITEEFRPKIQPHLRSNPIWRQ